MVQNKKRFNHTGIPIIVIVTFIVAIKLLELQRDSRQQKQLVTECFTEKKKVIRGLVTSAYYDEDINVKAFRINFRTGESYINPIFLKSLNGFVEVGDSIFKEANSFKFFIYKKNSAIPIIFEDTVNCSKI